MPLIYFANTDFLKTVDPQIRTGDALVFRGVGFVSDAIELLTGSESHFASCVRMRGLYAFIIESTTLNGKNGVQMNQVDARISGYDAGKNGEGAIHLLRLSDAERAKMYEQPFIDFLMGQIGKPYAKMLIAHLFFDRFQLIPAKVNFQDWDCSELGCEAEEKSNILPPSLDAAEVTPTQMCKYKLWAPDYYQLKGKQRDIPGFNSIEIPGR